MQILKITYYKEFFLYDLKNIYILENYIFFMQILL